MTALDPNTKMMNLPLNRTMITLAIMMATVMQAIDGTIANVALPHMQGSLNASQDQITWVLTSFIVAAAIGTPVTGWLADRFGQKRLFLISISGFTLASILCGLAGNLAEMVGARLLQGVLGAALVPLSQSLMLDMTPREKQGSAMAVWGMGVMIGPILGPTLGGWLTDAYDWRWCFYINVPIGLAAAFGVLTYVPNIGARRSVRFDVIGFMTLSLFIGALQIMLDRGQSNDWFESTETQVEALIVALSFAVFVIHTLTRAPANSFFDIRLLMNGNFVAGIVFAFIVGMVLFSTRALMPSMLQGLMHFTALDAGIVMAPSGLGSMLAMMIVGRLIGKIDTRLILAFGFGMTALSLYMMCGYTTELKMSDIIWPGVVQGIGLGFVFVPLSAAAFSTLASSLRPQGTAIYSLMRNIGSSVGIAMVQAFQVANSQTMHQSISDHMTLGNHALTMSRYLQGQGGLMALNIEVTRQASMIAYVDNFWLMLILTLCAMPLLIFMRSKK